MGKRTDGAIWMVCTMSAAVGVVAFGVITVLGDFAVSPAVFVAVLVTMAVAAFLAVALLGKAGDPPVNLASAGSADSAFTPSALRAEAPDGGSGRTAAEMAPAPDRATVAATLDTDLDDTRVSNAVEPDNASPETPTGSTVITDEPWPGTKPNTMSAPRDGGADDLKMIKGVGPKLEGVCNDLGFYHFDQIASWTPAEVAWVDENLEGFKGRVSRDEWVEQARVLAAGGDTEISQKVEDGDVY